MIALFFAMNTSLVVHHNLQGIVLLGIMNQTRIKDLSLSLSSLLDKADSSYCTFAVLILPVLLSLENFKNGPSSCSTSSRAAS